MVYDARPVGLKIPSLDKARNNSSAGMENGIPTLTVINSP